MPSLVVANSDILIGSEIALMWGEQERGLWKSRVEHHVQMRILAVISPCLYSAVLRTSYAQGWHTKAVGG